MKMRVLFLSLKLQTLGWQTKPVVDCSEGVRLCQSRALFKPVRSEICRTLSQINCRHGWHQSLEDPAPGCQKSVTPDRRCQTMRQLCYSAQTFEIDPCTLSEIWQMRSSMTPCAAGDDANHPSLCVNFLFAFGDEADKQLRTLTATITFGFRIWWRCLARSFLIT